MATTRGVRMETETIQQLQRLTWATRRTQAELLRQYVGRAYAATLADPKYGPRLRMAEQDEAEGQAREPAKKARGAMVRLNEQEAKALRRRAYEQTGDPGQATQLARQAIREKLIDGGDGTSD